MKLPKFPQTIEYRNSRVTIYHLTRGKYHEFKVIYFHEGKRKSQTFADYKKAKARADAINDSVNSGEVEALSLSRSQLHDYQQAVDTLASTSLSLASVATQFTEAAKLLGSASILEAAQFYRSKHQLTNPKPIAQVREEFIAAKPLRGLSAHHIQRLTRLLTRLEKFFQCELAAITGADLIRFLSAGSPDDCKHAKAVRAFSPVSFNNYRTMLGEFFRFAIRRKYIPSDWAGIQEVENQKIPPGEIEIYTPKEIRLLLEASPNGFESERVTFRARTTTAPLRGCSVLPGTMGDLRLYLAIAAFTGMRGSEIMQLRWEEIGAKYIEVKAKNAKTRQRRLVPISDNLRAWLKPYVKSTGLIFTLTRAGMEVRRLSVIKRLGMSPKRNALRHSYISYRVAQISDVAKVALEAGNSPQIIFQHYRELVSPEAAAEWFALMPGKADNVIDLEQPEPAKVQAPEPPPVQAQTVAALVASR